jgi:hypothetical protein
MAIQGTDRGQPETMTALSARIFQRVFWSRTKNQK